MSSQRWTLVRVTAFILVTGLFTVGLGMLVANFRIMPTNTYSARFADVSGLKVGEEVKAAGVVVGQVENVDVDGTDALVTFNLDSEIPLTTASHAAIRWKNLIGDRYIDLTSTNPAGPPLPAGAVLALSNTEPSLDLDQLSNGFRPLFEGLQPAQVNQLTGELIQVFRGQGATLDQLLTDLGAFTNGLADRDAVIGRVIDNLNTVLGTLDTRHDDLGNLIVQTDRLTAGLNQNRATITKAAERIGDASSKVASLLQRVRPDTRDDIDQIGKLAELLNLNKDQVNGDLAKLPPAYAAMNNSGRTGSFFTFFICGAQIRTVTPSGQTVLTPMIAGEKPRCQ